jgi:hypothetical protein
VVDIDEGNAQRASETLGEAHTHEQRAHQARSTRKSYCRQLLLGDAGALQRLVDHWHHILLMGTRGQLGHHAAIGFMNSLRGRDVAQQHPVAQHGCRRIVATRLYS